MAVWSPSHCMAFFFIHPFFSPSAGGVGKPTQPPFPLTSNMVNVSVFITGIDYCIGLPIEVHFRPLHFMWSRKCFIDLMSYDHESFQKHCFFLREHFSSKCSNNSEIWDDRESRQYSCSECPPFRVYSFLDFVFN